jgi:hypothetical protein
LGISIILIGSQFVRSGSFNFIFWNTLSLLKAEGTIELGPCMTRIGSRLATSNSVNISPDNDRVWKVKSMPIARNSITHEIPPTKSSVKNQTCSPHRE